MKQNGKCVFHGDKHSDSLCPRHKIAKDGPDKVLVFQPNIEVTPEIADSIYNIKPDIVFLNDDGSSLGAPSNLKSVAMSLHHGKWVAFAEKPFEEFKSIQDNAG